MSGSTIARLGAVAVERWGMFTTAQAAEIGIPRKTLSGLVASDAVERLAQGVYRMAGVPAAETEIDEIRKNWLALGGATRPHPTNRVPALVAAAKTAAALHRIGDWFPDTATFIVPERRATRLSGIRLPVRRLAIEEITYVEGLPALTVERTICDLLAEGEDTSLVADALSHAVQRGSLVSPRRLSLHLDAIARRHGHESGDSYMTQLFQIAGLPESRTTLGDGA